MPTTSYANFVAAARAIANRTDSSGTAVDDISGEEDALIHLLVTEGIVTPANAYEVNPQSGMTVRVGSQTAQVDTYIVPGTVSGQNPYIARLDDAYVDVTLDGSDLNDRLDAIYLVVSDDTYDAGGESLPRIGYRRNDAGDTSSPGPDSEWTAYSLLAEIYVSGGSTSVSSGDISDQRVTSQFAQRVFDEAVRNTLASVFGEVLDSRYVNEAGDSMSGNLEMQQGQYISLYDENGTEHRVRDTGALSEESEGLVIETISNPASGDPILIINSSGSAQRFRVEHNGALRSDNSQLFLDATSGSGGNPVSKIEKGQYSGDGSDGRKIGTNIEPWWVYLIREDTGREGWAMSNPGQAGSGSRGVGATKLGDGDNAAIRTITSELRPELDTDGFFVSHREGHTPASINESGVTYSYIVLGQ